MVNPVYFSFAFLCAVMASAGRRSAKIAAMLAKTTHLSETMRIIRESGAITREQASASAAQAMVTSVPG